MYFVYILYSEKLDKYYIGYSTDIQSRLNKHNALSKGFTNLGKPWTLMHYEAFKSKKEAMEREKQLKNWKNRQNQLRSDWFLLFKDVSVSPEKVL